jgi:AsmA protein
LAVELRSQADGTTNWADLLSLALGGSMPQARLIPGSIHLSGAEIEGASVHYVDEQAHSEYRIRDASLRAGALTRGLPFAVDARFRLEHEGHAATVRARAEARFDGSAGFELKSPSVALEVPEGDVAGGITLAIDAPSARYDAGTLLIDAPRVEIKSGQDGHLQVSGSLTGESATLQGADVLALAAPVLALVLEGDRVPGGRQTLRAEAPALAASLGAQTLSVEDLKAEAGEVALHASVTGTSIIDAPRLTGRLTLAPFSPRALMENLGRPVVSVPDPAALTQADLSAQYELSTSALRLYDMKLTLDNTHVTGEAVLSAFPRPALRFTLAADRLPLDRYVTPSALDTASGTPGPEHLSIGIDRLGALDVEGSLIVSELTFAGVRATAAVLGVHGPGGSVRASPASAAGLASPFPAMARSGD